MEVAIVGGGIAGLILALTLHKHAVKFIVYEFRQTSDIANPGAIGLAPNAIRPLDKLGLYDELRGMGWPLEAMQFRNVSDELISTLGIGGPDRYGYDALRIVRRKLHDVLLTAVEKAGIKIITGKKFSHVVSITPDGVTIAFTDETQVTASLVVGADGIHSTVRKFIAPEARPEYKGSLTMTALLPKNPLLDLPQTPETTARLHSISITTGPNAAFIAIVQSADGHEISLGLDRPYPDQSRETWEALLADHQRQYELFVEDCDSWPESVRILMRQVEPENMYRSWPFYALPDLEQWSTPDRKVVLVGDAAHAVPPSAGQGACMAVEDAWSLGLVVASCQMDSIDTADDDFQARIVEWQAERRDRVDKVRKFTTQMGNVRLPEELRRTVTEYDFDELSWLYAYEYQGR